MIQQYINMTAYYIRVFPFPRLVSLPHITRPSMSFVRRHALHSYSSFHLATSYNIPSTPLLPYLNIARV